MKEKTVDTIYEILEMWKKLMSVSDEESKADLQKAIDFKTKTGIRYITYEKGGDKILCLINTEDNSTINFKVESVLDGINYERFHPEAMFESVMVQ